MENAIAVAKGTLNGAPKEYLLINPATGGLIVEGSDTPPASPGTIGVVADITTGGAAVALGGAVVTTFVTLVCPTSNTDIVRYGDNSIAAGGGKGAFLLPGQSQTISINLLSKIFVWSPTAGQKVAVTYEAP